MSNTDLKRQAICILIFVVAAISPLKQSLQLSGALSVCLFSMVLNFIDKEKFIAGVKQDMTRERLDVIFDNMTLFLLGLYIVLWFVHK